jgi:hypothetical protein
MTDDALEDRMHAVIQSKVPIFLPAGNIEYMTNRDDWTDINRDYKDIVTDDLIARLTNGAGKHAKEGFAARKNGQFGVWIEKEYVSATSDFEDIVQDVYGKVEDAPTSEMLIAQAAFAAIQLQGSYPEAQFHVIEGRDTWSTGGGRVCLSVFIPEGVTDKQSIISAYYDAELPKLDVGIVKQVFGEAYDDLAAYFTAKAPVEQASLSMR